MAAAPPAATDADECEADSYIGSLISLISKADIRYEGILYQFNAKESTIALRNVKSFGTEGRKDGSQVAPSDRVYDYIYFRGSDIKDLQVKSFPPVQSTPTVPDDPAIIQTHHSLPPHTTISSASLSDLGGTNLSSNAPMGNQVLPFQGNKNPFQLMEVSRSWTSVVSSPPINLNGPAMQSYWPGFNELPGVNSHFQQQAFPPPPQGLFLPNPIQKQLPHPSMNPSLAGNALNFAELPHTLLPPVCTGSLNLISTVSPPSAVQYSPIPISTLFSNISSRMSNNVSNSIPTEMADSGSLVVSSPLTTSDMKSVMPITDQAKSILGPAPFPLINKSTSSFGGSTSASRGKASVVPPATPGSHWQEGLVEPSSSCYLKAENDKIILASASNLQPSDSQNFEELALGLPKLPVKKMHEGVSSSYYGSKHLGQGCGDMIYGDMLHPYQSTRGYVKGRARGNVPNRTASHNYQSYRGHPVGRRSGIGTASYHRRVTRCLGRQNSRNTVAPYYLTPAWGGSEAVTNFGEDFDFEAMNEKFNKEEIWGRLGKTKQAGSDDKTQDEKEGDGREAADESEDGLPKLAHKYGYCKEDFFDSLSCAALDGKSGRGKMKFSELRKMDAETFGEIPQPSRGGVSQDFNHGREYDNAGKGRKKTVWNRVT